MAVKTERKPPQKKAAQPVQKKPQKRPAKPKQPEITQAQFEAWFFSLEPKAFAKMQQEWNEKNLKVDLKPQKDYDAYLNYFKTLPPSTVRVLITTGQGVLSTEAFAALLRWSDILSNPHRIDKIHQAGLTAPKKEKQKSITELATNNDLLGVLRATRDKIAEKLEKGAGARDTAALAREMSDIMSQIEAHEKRKAPSKNTMLGKLTDGMQSLKKRDRKSGVRGTSFSSRVTIDDVEENNG